MKSSLSPQGFACLGVSSSLVHRLSSFHIVCPTPIQGLTIPPALRGLDLIGLAETGSGKTLAFGLPIIENLRPGEQALVLAPTRELAEQISETLASLQIRCVLVVGGKSMNIQIQQLRKSPQVIVATPGRLKDLLGQRALTLDRIRILVLDEADRMLDMGFLPDIKRIVGAAPVERQTMLFSATLPPEVETLAAEFLRNPVRLEADRSGTTPKQVEQELFYVEFADKHAILGQLIQSYRGSIIVFVRTRHGARKLAKHIRTDGHKAAEIHSDRTQAQRREALEGFKSGAYRILVATDIAARGIDVKDIELVLNYDVPEQPEDYVHRIGRTARAGAQGTAITLALHSQRHLVKAIEKILGEPIPTSRRMGALLEMPKPSRRAETRSGTTDRSVSDHVETPPVTPPKSRPTAQSPQKRRPFEPSTEPVRPQPNFSKGPKSSPKRTHSAKPRPASDQPQFDSNATPATPKNRHRRAPVSAGGPSRSPASKSSQKTAPPAFARFASRRRRK